MSNPNTKIASAMKTPTRAENLGRHVVFDLGVTDPDAQNPTGSFVLPLHSEVSDGNAHQIPTRVLTSIRVRKTRPTAIYIPKREQAAVQNYEFGNARSDSKRTHALSPVSPKSMSATHQRLEKYEFDDEMSYSNYSPVSTDGDFSPMTLNSEGGYTLYSPIKHSWADDVDIDSDAIKELNRAIAEELFEDLFFLASFPFFANLDIKGLLEPTSHLLEDYDELKGSPRKFDLSPHYEDDGCHCYACTKANWAREIGYGAHDFSRFCSCAKCEVLEMKNEVQQREANCLKERNAARAERGNALKKSRTVNAAASAKTEGSPLFGWIRKTLREEE